jgi:hypothetical protein
MPYFIPQVAPQFNDVVRSRMSLLECRYNLGVGATGQNLLRQYIKETAIATTRNGFATTNEPRLKEECRILMSHNL